MNRCSELAAHAEHGMKRILDSDGRMVSEGEDQRRSCHLSSGVEKMFASGDHA